MIMSKPLFEIKAKAGARIVATIFGFVFLASAVLTGYLSYRQIFVLPNWELVEASVTRVDAVRKTRAVRVYYTYSVNGSRYEGFSRSDIRPGNSVSIRINPSDPAQSEIQRSYTFWLVWTVLMIPFSILILFRAKYAIPGAEYLKKYS